MIQLRIVHLLPEYLSAQSITAALPLWFNKTADYEALLCRGQDGFEDQEGFVQGWADTIELLKVLAARAHHEILHQLCDHCSPKK